MKSNAYKIFEEWIEEKKKFKPLGWNGGEARRIMDMLEEAWQLGRLSKEKELKNKEK